jgi:hypothetical protein
MFSVADIYPGSKSPTTRDETVPEAAEQSALAGAESGGDSRHNDKKIMYWLIGGVIVLFLLGIIKI